MEFFVLCLTVSFLTQTVLLAIWKSGGHRCLKWVSLLVLELFPLARAGFYGLTRPQSFFGWEFSTALYLWVAGAVLLGYAAAWIVFLAVQKRR